MVRKENVAIRGVAWRLVDPMWSYRSGVGWRVHWPVRRTQLLWWRRAESRCEAAAGRIRATPLSVLSTVLANFYAQQRPGDTLAIGSVGESLPSVLRRPLGGQPPKVRG